MRKKFVISFFILAFLLQGFAVAADQTAPAISKKAQKMLKKADKAIKAKKFDKAYELYDEIMKLEPECAIPYYGKARLQLAEKKYAEGEKNLEKALEMNPDYREAALMLSKLYFAEAQQHARQRDTEKANGYFEKLIAIKGIADLDKQRYGNSLYQLAVNNYTHKNFAKSNEYMLKFRALPLVQTEFAPMYTASDYIVGLNYSQLKEYAKSDESLKNYIEAKKDVTTDQLLPLAYFVIANNNFIQLEKEANKIKEDKTIKDHKAAIAKAAQAREAAILPNLKKSIELKSDLEPAYMNMGNFFYYANNIDETIKTYEELISKFAASQDLAQYKSFLEDVKKEKANSKKK